MFRLIVLRSIPIAVALILAVVVAVAGVSAQDDRSAQDFVVFLGASSGNCNGPVAQILRHRSTNVYMTGTVVYNGSIVSDSAWEYAPDTGQTGLFFGYYNMRGLAPVDLYPLASGTPLYITATVWSLDWEPLYETRGML